MDNSHSNSKQTVRVGSGKIVGDFISGDGNVISRNNNIAGDWIISDKVMGSNTVNHYNSTNLAEAAKEIQALIEQLAKTYPADTRAAKNSFADEIVEQIEANSALANRLLKATKTGGVAAIEQFLNHPAVSFIVAAIEDWEKTKNPDKL
jgi:translation initiation factor IF-2